MDRKGSAVWQGDLKGGKGTMSVESGLLKDAPYSFQTRFEDAKGTNPEELIGAAHAGCFSMAFSNNLATAGHVPDKVETTATVTMKPVDGAPTVTAIHLAVSAKVPGIGQAEFDEIAKKSKETCPISRLLKAAEITMDAKLVS